MAANSKSPAELKSEGEELKALFAKVKKKQHNCAILMAKDGIVVEAHIKKSPDVLLKAGKKNGGMPKGAWGTMTMDGQVIRVDPINDKVPGNLAKLAKKFFAARGLKFRLEIIEPEEGEAESEEEVAQEQDSGKSTAAVEEPSEEAPAEAKESPSEEDGGGTEAAEQEDPRVALEARLEEMQKQIEVLQADTENVMYSALQDTLAAHKRAMDGEDFERGAGTLDNLDGVLEDYAGILAEKTPLQERMDVMAKDAERIKKGDDSEAADQIGRTMREFDYALANNEWVGSGERLDIIKEMIKKHLGGAKDPSEDDEDQPEAATTEASSDAPAEAAQTSEPESSTPSDTKAIRKQFDGLMPAIRQAAASEDAPLKKKVALLIKGFNSELKNGGGPKCMQILDALDSLLKKFESSTPSAAPDDGADAEEAVKVKAERKTKLMSVLQNMKSELSGMMAELE